MKKTLFLLLLLISFHAFSQSLDCEQEIQKELIEKLLPYGSNKLIPYHKDNTWGYFDKESGNIVTPAIFVREPKFFSPNVSLTIDTKQGNYCEFTLSSSKTKFKIINLTQRRGVPEEEESPETKYLVAVPIHSDIVSQEKKRIQQLVNKEISGFRVDKKDQLVSIGCDLYDSIQHKLLIREHSIFKWKNKYYAVKHDNNYFSIINEDGNAVKGFEKLSYYPSKKEQYFKDEEEVWFFIKNGDSRWDGYTLKSFDRKLDEKILGTGEFKTPSWNVFSEIMGYAIVETNEGNGVLDLTNMNWKVEPTNDLYFWNLYYTSLIQIPIKKEDLTKSDIESFRKKIDIYILTSVGRDKIYYDMELNPIKVNK